jgi:PDDEXK-like domain of unknown function (DUF3799)
VTAVLAPPAGRITREGLYDIPSELYHLDPVDPVSLSSSGLRDLLLESPLEFIYNRTHHDEGTRAQQLGTVAHLVNFGVGEEIEVIREDSYRTNRAKEKYEKAVAAGRTPILKKDYDRTVAMRDALLVECAEHRLLHPEDGVFERTLVARDDETGVMLRAMVDYLRNVDTDGVRMVVDYKTSRSVSRYALQRAMWDYGYHMQGAHYRKIVRRLCRLGLLPPAERTTFLLLVQRTTPPYPVVPVPIAESALAYGDAQNRKAIDLYLECVEADRWPGPARGKLADPLTLPGWGENQLDDTDLRTRSDREDLF